MKLSKNARLRLLGLPIGLLAGVLVLLLQMSGLFQRFELASLNSRYRTRGSRPLGDEILVVTLDNPAMKQLGWPIPRTAWAALIDTAFEHGAKVVGFDILFADPGRSRNEDKVLANVALSRKKVVFPAQMLFRDQEDENYEVSDSYMKKSALTWL